MSVAIAPRRLARRFDHHGFGRLRPLAAEDTGAVALALPRGFRYRELPAAAAPSSQAWLLGVRYEAGPSLLRHVDDGLQALAVRGRPGFSASEAIAGLAYRTEWVLPDTPPAAALGPARGVAVVGGRVLVAGADALWAFEPRDPIGGVLSLLERRGDEAALVGALGDRALVAAGHELRLREAGGAEHPLARVLVDGAAPVAARLEGSALRLVVASEAAAPRAYAVRGALR